MLSLYAIIGKTDSKLFPIQMPRALNMSGRDGPEKK